MGRNDGFLSSAHDLRNQYRADFVTLFIADAADYCGISEPMDSSNYQNYEQFAFNVVKAGDGCLANLVLTHELGHGMGAQHDYATTGGEYQGLYNYSYGYQNPGAVFRTVMAYNCSRRDCPRLPYFSNPNVFVNDMVTGITDAADNAKTLNNTRNIAANLRSSTISPILPGAMQNFLSLPKGTDRQSSSTEETRVIADTLNQYLDFASSTDAFEFKQSFIAEYSRIKAVSFVIRKQDVPRFAVRLALLDSQGSTVTFTMLTPGEIPSFPAGRAYEWTRIDFREPIRVTAGARYYLTLSTESTNRTAYYGLGIAPNSYPSGSLTVKNKNPKALQDLMLKIHYLAPPKNL